MIGHSTGGMLGIRYALSYPQQTEQLVLVDPIGLEDWRAKGVPPVSVDQWYTRELATSAERIRNYEKNTYFAGTWRADYEPSVQMLAGMYRGPQRALVAWNSALLYDMILTQPVYYELPQIKVPTLLMIGDKDTTAIGKEFAPPEVRPSLGNYPQLARHAAAMIAHAKLVEFADAGHAPQMQQPEIFHEALLKGMAELEKPLATVFAPNGALRASINLGNPVLASLDPQTGKPVGVSVDLATELARRLGVPLQLVAVTSASGSVDNVEQGKADIGFFAVDPKRGQEISFTQPYVLIEGFYAVRNESAITNNEQLDQSGINVAVGKGSAYDLFLTRELKHATIVRIPTSPAVVQEFLNQHLEVAAGVKQQLEKDAVKAGGLRILDQRFMVIRQSMGVPKAKGKAAATYLTQFVEDMKASGFIDAALTRHHIEGAIVAKPGD
jgi:polar amino acid transport system substrate-binding protein